MIDAVKMVLSGLIGIRRKADHERSQVHPVQLVVVAVAFVALFVVAIATLVHFITT